MLLAIDAGNTNVCFAVYDGEEQIELVRVETGRPLGDTFHNIAEKYPKIEAVVVCSVVPDWNLTIKEESKECFGLAAVFITHDNIDIGIEIDEPAQLGADRMVGASAAMAYYQAPCVIVDFGTATTFDVVNEKGAHQGGIITSGVNLSLLALEQAAAQLPDIKIEQPTKVIGTNTSDAMQSGVYWGYISMVEGLIARISHEMDAKPFVIATGGLAPLFEKGTYIFDIIDQDLIMKGLVHMHKVLNK